MYTRKEPTYESGKTQAWGRTPLEVNTDSFFFILNRCQCLFVSADRVDVRFQVHVWFHVRFFYVDFMPNFTSDFMTDRHSIAHVPKLLPLPNPQTSHITAASNSLQLSNHQNQQLNAAPTYHRSCCQIIWLKSACGLTFWLSDVVWIMNIATHLQGCGAPRFPGPGLIPRALPLGRKNSTVFAELQWSAKTDPITETIQLLKLKKSFGVKRWPLVQRWLRWSHWHMMTVTRMSHNLGF